MVADKRGKQAMEALEILAKDSDAYDAIIAAAKIATADENIVSLLECADTLMAKLAGVDAASYTVAVQKQDQLAKNGGYRIDSLNQNQLIYFAATCLSDAANALASY